MRANIGEDAAAVAFVVGGIALFLARRRVARSIEEMVRTRFPGMAALIRNGRSPAHQEVLLAYAYGAAGIMWVVGGLVVLFTPGH